MGQVLQNTSWSNYEVSYCTETSEKTLEEYVSAEVAQEGKASVAETKRGAIYNEN
jgi:hypothetical protein